MKKDYLNSKSLADGTVVRMSDIFQRTQPVQIYVQILRARKDGHS